MSRPSTYTDKLDLDLWKRAEAEAVLSYLHRASAVAKLNRFVRRCRIGAVRLKKVQA